MRPGEQRLRAAVQRRQTHARKRDPEPYDDTWGWWIDNRLGRIENSQKWLIRIAAGILVAEIIRAAFATL